ncbi:MAG TPA: M15 family metallopeptidase [Candidatus Paceibacterota bacterium]|nr:M15 family metallopeptidase [Candidatus Paceibacterota bacterium]
MALAQYQLIPLKENNEPLVDLSTFDFVLAPSYFEQGLSPDKRMFLREGVAKKLETAQKKLGKYKFKIWDGYRSRLVQNTIYKKFWDELQAKHPEWGEERLKREVAVFVNEANDPNRIPPHASGGAVDLTLVDLDGNELNMGTVFDHFGPEAHANYYEENNIDTEIAQNRRILREALEAEGFKQYPDEWWHFDYGNQLWAFEIGEPYAIYGEAVFSSVKK